MATKNVIADLVKGEKLNGDNYDIWHKKMKFMLNEQELEEHLTKEMVAPTEAQPLRDHTAYQKWNKKDRSARYTLLSSLQNDLIGQYDELPTCKALWEQLKFSFGGTSTTRLRSLVIKFEEYTKDPKHTMSEHLRVMSNMIGKLRDAGHALTDEQQVRAVIRSLPASWANMKQILTHNENIKNFSDVSQHVILEAETRDADKTLTYVAQEGSRNANGKHGRQSYVMYGEHPNGGRTEIESRDVDFIKSDFPSIGDASKNLDLYELEEVEPTLPSPSEGGELVPRPVVAKDSASDLQTSGSIPDSGSTPQGPLGQQDSQLRRAGNDMSSIVATKQWLSSTFEMKDMGEANYVLGVKIVRDRSKRLLGLSQETYIKKVIERFRMHNSKPIDTPMDKACTLTTDQCPKNDEKKNQMSKVPYAAVVESLMYAMLCTLLDICYAVGMVNRYQSNPGPTHWNAVKRILQYLRGTADLVLCYHGGDLRLRAYNDVDWGANRDERRSTSSGAISWYSKKKSCIALSTMESEYALGVTTHVDEVVAVHCENTAALDFVKDPKYHGKAKHIGLRYHFIRALVAQGEVSMKHIPTGRMVADPLTKPIARDVFLSHIRSMGLRSQTKQTAIQKYTRKAEALLKSSGLASPVSPRTLGN
ncbi:hypothetical protein RJ640_009848 [Escallonia rubra]|uniref:Reverse transcriptase Ty1/copia-type domain-containing protein n=1 Tax=Escallonia rubra TaxID=112253 RepID=A0AA88UC63_9ASTE|nr:hypothetical protein RJ640_009848 [Escallonia rubra]